MDALLLELELSMIGVALETIYCTSLLERDPANDPNSGRPIDPNVIASFYKEFPKHRYVADLSKIIIKAIFDDFRKNTGLK